MEEERPVTIVDCFAIIQRGMGIRPRGSVCGKIVNIYFRIAREFL